MARCPSAAEAREDL